MNLGSYGYTERKFEARKMNIAELKIGVAQYCAEKNYDCAKIKVVDIYSGDVDVYNTPKDFVLSKCNDSWRISFLSIKEVLIYNEEIEASELTLIIVIEDAEV